MRRLCAALRSRQKAANTITFAFLAPVLLLILFATMEGGRVFSAWLVITNEAREAARYGAVNYGRPDLTPSTIQTYVTGRLRGQLDTREMYQQPRVILGANGTSQVDVTIYYQVRLVIPIVDNVLPNPFKLTARSVMRGE